MSQELVRETGLSTPRTPAQELVAQVRGEQFRQQVAMALPPSVTPERFLRVATTALLANPDIAKLDHTSVLRAMIQSASMGLIPDGKQAAITPRKGQAVLVPMIQGFRDIAADHGWTLRTAVVYSEDEFEHAVVDGEEQINHRPVRPGAERGELIAAYAIAKHRDGRRMQVVLHPADIALRRESASTKQVWDGPHTAAMWEKSAGRDLFGQLGLAESDERVTRVLVATELEPGEAAHKLYGNGGPAAEPPALEAAETDQVDASSTTADGEGQQAAVEASISPAEAAAPDPDELPGEPAPDEPSAFQAPVEVDVDPVIFAAKEASQVIVPIGAWKGKSLAEIHAAGDKGVQWIKYALAEFDERTGTTKSADPKMESGVLMRSIWAFARVYTPDLFQAELAKREAAAA